MATNKGYFISFEGGEGVGKTTQIQALASHLKQENHDVVVTREPGGCPAAEDIRNLIFASKHAENWTPKAETLMMFAAREMHLKEVIIPALNAGKIVLCDRYMDSTQVYQGDVKGVSADLIDNLKSQIIGDYMPNLTFILDLPAKQAMARVQSRGAENHHDRGDTTFHEGLRNGFIKIAKDNPERCHVIDANRDIDIISQDIKDITSREIVNV